MVAATLVYQLKFELMLRLNAAVSMSAWLLVLAKKAWALPPAATGKVSNTFVALLCCPGSPGVLNACAQPKCTLSVGFSSWLANSHLPFRGRSFLNCRAP